METARTIQTAFRFNPDLLQRMKNKARYRGQSLNRYVESVIECDLGLEHERYEALFQELSQIELPEEVSPEVKDLSKNKVEFTAEEIAADERLAYLLSK